ncbi:ChrR family anti-sigma-E factor [Enterovibrio sp. ZSDZ35]|uniref:ChrR family anti-sigma-E factor n=1 Tax=Enterovibrio qingdaonensis TaxID=2899818 RepID=A0ABT5QSW9_9GAMM|nr:ChrR family anti-sigma-E factor [Enterovibrio sp. ZSDZ35]MDD1783689.1 ChrR family anti-sigma-E factor [Enterovibrio sp. ZSDZ35]
MIKYHPSDDLLRDHAAGTLLASMSIAVSAHCEMCKTCRQRVMQLEQQIADDVFADNHSVGEQHDDLDDTFENMMTAITSDSSAPVTLVTPSPASNIDVGGERYALPIALRRYHHLGWSSIGAISRARLPLNEGDTRASLLHIGMNGSVPSHTHKGMEVTLLLSGHFEDEHDTYVPGDFIVLDASNNHTPHTRDGCLCYTVADAPLHFTKGVSKLLNTVGRVIY